MVMIMLMMLLMTIAMTMLYNSIIKITTVTTIMRTITILITMTMMQQVLAAASSPPLPQYAFFLRSLLTTVRLNIGDCAGASYHTLTLASATKILMFESEAVSSSIYLFL